MDIDWGATIPVIVGTVVGAGGAIVGGYLTTVWQTKSEREARKRQFERESLLAFQDVAYEMYEKIHEWFAASHLPKEQREQLTLSLFVSFVLLRGRVEVILARVEDTEVQKLGRALVKSGLEATAADALEASPKFDEVMDSFADLQKAIANRYQQL